MSRGLFAGSTDYSHQSLDDILQDLKDWIQSIEKTMSLLAENKQVLEENNYWNTVDHEFRIIIDREMLFYQTSLQEITEISTELKSEVENHHIIRLRHLGKTAHEYNIEIGKTWHRNITQYATDDDYHNLNFQILEKIYAIGRDMAIDMMDLTNAANRISDYIGRKRNKSDDAINKSNTVNINGNFSGNLVVGDNNEVSSES